LLLHLLEIKFSLTVFFYNIFLLLYKAGIGISSLFNPKAKKWLHGRKNIFQKLEAVIPQDQKIIWVHCSSLGEFEQGRPIIERLGAQGTGQKILLTFFSPSGYEVQKDYKGADWVFYLPMDGAINAKRFLDIVNPSLVIFIKYDYWFYYLKKIKYRRIPLILVSALFQKNSVFFRWYGFFQRKMLSRFDHLFVQNEESKQLLAKIGLGKNCTVSGDTRFDRVIEIAEKFEPLPLIEQFIGGYKCIVAGSTWKEDEELLKASKDFCEINKLKLIIAPHEVTEKHLADLLKLFPQSLIYSKLSETQDHSSNVLIIDTVGMLSRIYKYAYCAYVGGGLSRTGVHNVLEAAVFNMPVFFGPNYKKYQEAIDLINAKGANAINDKDRFIALLNQFLSNPSFYFETCVNAGQFVKNNTGAVKKILNYIQEKRLLTN